MEGPHLAARRARCLVVALVVGLSVPLWAAPASAAVTCAFNEGTATLQANFGDGDFLHLLRDGDEVRVRTINMSGPVDVTCSGAVPTVTNTDKIFVDGSSGINYMSVYFHGGYLRPGKTNEAGASDEIEIDIDLAGGTDQMFISQPMAGTGPNVRLGTNGINLDATETTGVDADLDVRNVEGLQLSGGNSYPSVISGAGGAGTGGPYPNNLDIRGNALGDTLFGGAGNDYIDGAAGNDLMKSGFGVQPDTMKGGDGVDTVSYAGVAGDVVVDLVAETASSDGSGWMDSIQDVENVTGGGHNDTLKGDSQANRLSGGGGVDTLVGRDNNDAVLGGTGNDTLKGNGGNDNLNGGIGTDLCRGGTGTNVRTNCER